MTRLLSLSFAMFALAACGDSTTTDGGTDSGATDAGHDAGAVDAGTDAGDVDLGGLDLGGLDLGVDLGTADAGDTDAGGCTGTTLTVKNALVWCSVSVAGMPASSAAQQTVCVPSGDVALTATALSGFELGLWHHTAGDTGSGDPGTVSGSMSSTHVAVTTGSSCVWVCCPFVGGSGCPTSDQCP